jgi:predicted aminopeptidase
VRAALGIALLLGVGASLGCQTDRPLGEELGWLSKQAVGQGEILLGSQRVSDVLAREETDPEVKRRLRLVLAARTFAGEVLGLNAKDQYERVVFLDAPAVVYVVSAAPKTELSPYRWEYPVLGALPYRGYYALEEAEAEAARMAEQGFDVDVRPVSTYSLLGVVPDPIVSPMLFGSDEARLVETVIHELAHATVFASGQGAFNEGLATFIGREGLRQFIVAHYGTDSAVHERMEGIAADRRAYSRAVGALAFDLRVLFARKRDLTETELLERRDAIFRSHQRHFRDEVTPALATFRYRGARLPDNNAQLSAYGLYTLQQHLYVRAYDQCERDMRCMLTTLREVAEEEDPELALAERLRREGRRERVLR